MYPIDKVFLGKPNDGNYESYYPQFTWTRVPGAKLYLIMVLDEDYNTMCRAMHMETKAQFIMATWTAPSP